VGHTSRDRGLGRLLALQVKKRPESPARASSGPSLDPLKVCYRLIGICAGKILNGAKPADLTVDQLLAGAASATHADVSSAKNKQRPSAGFA